MEESRENMSTEQQATNNEAEQTQQEPQVQNPLQARVTELEAQLKKARQEATDNWNKYVRERAEMDNFRKRQERISGDRVLQQKKAVLSKLLDVMDNVERALIYQETMDRSELQQALRMLQWQMGEVLRNEGLTPVSSVGEAFNPYLHEAIEAVEDSDQPEGTVVEEVRKGYTLGNETLRPARVKVSMGSNK